jgi:hypothetical protein
MKLKLWLGLFICVFMFGGWIQESTSLNQSEAEKIVTAQNEIQSIGIALMDYITDKATAPKQSGTYDRNSPFYEALCPFYIRSLPMIDPWGNHYLVYCGQEVDGKYGITGSVVDDFMIISYGKSGKIENWMYDSKNPENGLYSEPDPDKNIVYFNGSFIRGPKSKLP